MNKIEYQGRVNPVPVKLKDLDYGEIFVTHTEEEAGTAGLLIKLPDDNVLGNDGSKAAFINLSAVPPYCMLTMSNDRDVYRVNVDMRWRYADVK